MKRPRLIKAAAVAGVCALAGALAGIAGSAAAPPHSAKARASQTAEPQGSFAVSGGAYQISVTTGGPGPRHGPPGLPGLPGLPVHSETIVPNQAGDGFETITSDRGSFKTLSGNQLTITEGTKKATYKTVTLTIPTGATVIRNDAKAQLTDIKPGDEVMVNTGPPGTTVMAADAQHQKQVEGMKVGPLRMLKTGPVPPGSPPLPPPPGE
jgi:hypothetical protein